MNLHVAAPTVLGPGLDGWAASLPVLRGQRPWVEAPDWAPPPPSSLPPAERRRAGTAIRLAVNAASASAAASGLPAADLASVFGSSNGDGVVVAAILEALAVSPRVVSPTQFHNSVHNAAAAYWAIGAACAAPSTSLGCHDDTFAASLLRAAAEACAGGAPVLLCVYDAPLPEPLCRVRPTAIPFAAAMVLTAAPIATSCAALSVDFAPEPATAPVEPDGEGLRRLHHANPVARCLRLLEALARGRPTRLAADYLGDAHLAIEVRPC